MDESVETFVIPENYTACEITSVENQGNAFLVDFGDVKHMIPKSLCKVAAGKGKIAIIDWKYKQLGL